MRRPPLIGRHHRSLLDEDLRELIASIGEVVVYLERVGELDGRLFQLALVGVALAALEVSLLLLIGIAMTAHGETKCERNSQNRCDSSCCRNS